MMVYDDALSTHSPPRSSHNVHLISYRTFFDQINPLTLHHPISIAGMKVKGRGRQSRGGDIDLVEVDTWDEEVEVGVDSIDSPVRGGQGGREGGRVRGSGRGRSSPRRVSSLPPIVDTDDISRNHRMISRRGGGGGDGGGGRDGEEGEVWSAWESDSDDHNSSKDLDKSKDMVKGMDKDKDKDKNKDKGHNKDIDKGPKGNSDEATKAGLSHGHGQDKGQDKGRAGYRLNKRQRLLRRNSSNHNNSNPTTTTS